MSEGIEKDVEVIVKKVRKKKTGWVVDPTLEIEGDRMMTYDVDKTDS